MRLRSSLTVLALGGVLAAGATALPAGVCVTAVPLVPTPRALGLTTVTAVTAVTDHGGYRLTGLFPGRYRVRFSPGCGASGFTTQWWPQAPSKSAATIVTAQAGTTVAGIGARLRTAAG